MKIGCLQLRGLFILLLVTATPACARPVPNLRVDDPRSPVRLVRKIELPNVRGRIDHMALDPSDGHLFVAEYGNGSVDDVDLASGKLAGRITGLHEPQGVAWLQKQQEIAVACGDGSIHFYREVDRKEVARVLLGDDADNVRVDGRNGNLVVGYGSGALAVIDPGTHRMIRSIALPGHPEAFELFGTKVLVNVPDAHKILLADLDQGQVATMLSTGLRFGNYPMASDGSQIAVAFRRPGTLSVFNKGSRAELYSVPACGDADDIFLHSGSIIAICGEGVVQVAEQAIPHTSVRVATQRGARTGLLDGSRNKLFVAVPAGRAPAAIWELSFRLQTAR